MDFTGFDEITYSYTVITKTTTCNLHDYNFIQLDMTYFYLLFYLYYNL